MELHTVPHKIIRSGFVQEFREFAMRGNIVDLAVGIMIGAAFNKIITSLVNDVIMPPIGLIIGKVDFTNLFIDLSGKNYSTLAAAKEAGAATINYGAFLNNLIDFLIVAVVVFLIVRQINRMRRRGETTPTTKECPHCATVIPLKAIKCPACTSNLLSQ